MLYSLFAWQRNIATLSLASRSLSPYFYLSLVYREPRFGSEVNGAFSSSLLQAAMYSLGSHLKCILVFYFYVTSYPQTRWFKATTVSYLTSFESGIWAGLSWMIPFFYMASVS